MSGGSFDYLCHNIQDISQIERNITSMESMLEFIADHKEEIPNQESIIQYLQAKLQSIKAITQAYTDIWNDNDYELLRDIEWAASGDYNLSDIEYSILDV